MSIDLRSPAVTRASEQIRPAALRAHVSFLAYDLLEDGGTATRGHEIAARYIAAQLDAASLEPGTNGAWHQQVPLRRSSLDPGASRVEIVRRVAGLRTIPDPFPERMLFLGSDQYSFVKSGIPSLIVGTLGSGDARALARQWFQTRYHAPSDDLSQPMDFEAAAQLARTLFLIGYAVAQDEERPRWNPGDFYGRHFGGV